LANLLKSEGGKMSQVPLKIPGEGMHLMNAFDLPQARRQRAQSRGQPMMNWMLPLAGAGAGVSLPLAGPI
jgi:hypothetical protein